MNVPYHYFENHVMKVYQMIRNDLVYVLSKKKKYIYIYIYIYCSNYNLIYQMICNDLCSPKSITVLITICCGGSAAAVAALKSGSARSKSSCVLRVRGLAMLSRAVALL